MASSIVALLMALVRAFPAVAQIGQQFEEAFVYWKKQNNAKETDKKNKRDDAVIDGIAGKQLSLCSSCPFAGNPGGQHPVSDAAPGVPLGSEGSS